MASTTLLFLGIGAAVGLGWWLLEPVTPIYYRGRHQADLPGFFQSLFMFMREGSVVEVQLESSPCHLRLRKVYLADRRHGLRLEIPDVPAAEVYAGRVREMLAAAGFDCIRPKPLDPLWPAQGRILFAVDQLTAIDAFRAAEVMREAMGLEQDARYTMHIAGTPSLKAGREYRAAR